jgi:DNA-directed RNA polymerase subunit RPC12/RpoP
MGGRNMSNLEISKEYICSDCLQELVNGEPREDITYSIRMSKTLIKWGAQDYIPAGLSEGEDRSPAFSWKRCPLCGDLAGERYEYLFKCIP